MKKLKKSISSVYENNFFNESSSITKITSEFNSSNSRFNSPIISTKRSSYVFFSSNNVVSPIQKKKNLWKKKLISFKKNQKKKIDKNIMSEIIKVKDKTKKKYDSFHSFNLLNTIKINISDKLKNSTIKKKEKSVSLNNSIKNIKRSLSTQNQNLIYIKNNMQNYFDSTGKIKRHKKIIETQNINIDNDIDNIICENTELKEKINMRNKDTDNKNNIINKLRKIVQEEKKECKILSKEINQLIEDKKFLNSCLINITDKINKLNEILYKNDLKSKQIQSGLKTIINNFKGCNLDE